MPADPDPEPQPAAELVDVNGELQLRDPTDPPARDDARVGMRPDWRHYVHSDPATHPAWRAYVESIPDGGWPDETFEEWLLRQRVVALDPPGHGGSPFVCAADTVLPPGWVRGDEASERGPTTGLAYDPRRHTLVRTVGAVPSTTVAALEAAGFKHVELAPGHAFFVRDRTAPAKTAARTPHPNPGRSR
jgi:pimeloyl-ACP methyl ester carboxylesterase